MGVPATTIIDDTVTSAASGASPGRWRITRFRAFAIHLALSLLVFSSLLFAMLAWWYPGELFFLDGGWAGLKLVAMVDLVLGPALTLLLFKPGKPSLVFDMSVIAAIQIAALGFGFVTTHQQRTVAVVFADRAFWSVSATDSEEGDTTLRELDGEPRDIAGLVGDARRASPGAGGDAAVPLLLIPPLAPEESGRHLEDMFAGYPELRMRSDQYQVLERSRGVPESAALDVDDLDSGFDASAIRSAIAATGIPAERLQLVPFKGRFDHGIALFDPEQVRIVDYLPSAEVDSSGGAATVGAESSEER